MFARILLIVSLLWLTSPGLPLSARQETNSLPLEDLRTYIGKQMQESRVPGLALAIVQGDRIIFMEGFGIADPSGRPVTPQTPFIIGSSGKSITALAIMQLAEAGKLDLDAPVQRYLPWFTLADPAAAQRITVRHLLHHTSGLGTGAGLAQLHDRDTDSMALERHVRTLATTELSAPVGEKFQYSNANYTILGLVVQTVSGMSYEEYVWNQIFAPLEMRNSFLSKTEAQKQGLATGYLQWFGYPVAAPGLPFVRGELPAGFHISSAEDMGHYLIAHLNEGRYEAQSVLSPAGVATLQRPAVAAPPQGRSAMGWGARMIDDVAVLRHDGSVPGYLSSMIIVPERRLGVMVLMNTNNMLTGAPSMAIGENVTRILLGRSPVTPQVAPLARLLPLLLLLPLLQVAAALRWWRRLPSLPAGGTTRASGILLLRSVVIPLLAHLGLALLLLAVLPSLLGAPLAVVRFFQPEIGWIATSSGFFALGWGMLRSALALRRLRQPGALLSQAATVEG